MHRREAPHGHDCCTGCDMGSAHRKGFLVGKPAHAILTASSTPPALSCSSTYGGAKLPGLD